MSNTKGNSSVVEPLRQSRDKAIHTHPISASERRDAEAFILGLADGRVLDIGGAPKRHLAFKRTNVHSTCPFETPKDHSRGLEVAKELYCTHRLAETLSDVDCECSKAFSLVMFIHSHYYISADEMAMAVEKYGTVYVAAHRFEGDSGVTGGAEGKWVKTNGIVSHNIVGDSPYVHPDAEWLFTTRFSTSSVRNYGSTGVYRVSLSNDRVATPPVGELLETFQFKQHWIVSLFRSPQVVDLDRKFVAEMVTRIAHDDGADSKGLVAAARKWCAKYEMPHEYREQHVVYGTALAVNHAQHSSKRARSILAGKSYASLMWSPVREVLRQLRGPKPTLREVAPAVFTDVCLEGVLFKHIRAGATTTPAFTDRCVAKTIAVQVGPVIPSPYWLPRSCTHNTEVALRNRGMMEVPLAVTGGSIATLRDLCPPVDISEKILPVEEWIAKFPRARRSALLNARAKQLQESEVETLATYQAFVKVEPYFDENKDPRLIQGTDLSYQLLTGPSVAAIAERVKEYTHSKYDECRWVYTSGMTGEDIGSIIHDLWQREGDLCCVEADASRFDAHVSAKALENLADFYSEFGITSSVTAALRSQVTTSGYCMANGIKYSVPGTRKSGTADTSLGNSLLTAMVWSRAGLRKQTGILFVQGDDSLFVGPRHECEALMRPVQASYTEFGFVAPVQFREDVYDAEFCSAIIVPVTTATGGATFVLAPKPGRTLAKLFIKRDPAAVKNYSSHEPIAKQLAEGFRNSFLFMPVVGPLFKKVSSLCSLGKKHNHQMDIYRHKIRVTGIYTRGPSTDSWFRERYGVTTEEILKHEKDIDNMTNRCVSLRGKIYKRMLNVDLECKIVC